MWPEVMADESEDVQRKVFCDLSVYPPCADRIKWANTIIHWTMIDPFPGIPIFLIIFAAMLVRTLTGFGSALLAVPLLSILLGAKYAVPFIMVYEVLIDLMILGREGRRLGGDLAGAWPLLLAGLAGVPIGAEVLMAANDRLLKGGMGIALIVFSILLLRDLGPKLRRGGIASAASGLLAGFLCGSTGLPGPPMALLLRGQGFEKGEFRRLIVLFLTAVDLFAFGYFLWAGLINKEMLNNSLFFLPAMVLGFIAGGRAFGRVDEASFRRLTLGITLAAGVLLLLTAAR